MPFKTARRRQPQAAITVLTVPIRAAIESLQDPAATRQLLARAKAGPDGMLQLVAVTVRAAQVIPALVTMERLALGLTTDSIEVDDPKESSLASRIVKDPVATELAIQLLDQLAGTGPVAAIGLGPSSEPGPGEDSVTFQPADTKTH